MTPLKMLPTVDCETSGKNLTTDKHLHLKNVFD